MTDPLAILQAAHARLIALPDPACQHVAAGIAKYLSAEAATLDAALGLDTSRAERAKAARNWWLREARRTLDGPSGFARCRRLAEEVRQFESRTWPRWRELDAPPPGSSRLRTALWHAFRCAGDYMIPRTAQGIDDAVTFQVCAPINLTRDAVKSST